jgi:hypothetical protein
MSSDGLEGAADVGPYGVQELVKTASRSSTFHSAGVVATAPGVRLHARGRQPCCNSGRDGDPPA